MHLYISVRLTRCVRHDQETGAFISQVSGWGDWVNFWLFLLEILDLASNGFGEPPAEAVRPSVFSLLAARHEGFERKVRSDLMGGTTSSCWESMMKASSWSSALRLFCKVKALIYHEDLFRALFDIYALTDCRVSRWGIGCFISLPVKPLKGSLFLSYWYSSHDWRHAFSIYDFLEAKPVGEIFVFVLSTILNI